MIEDQDRRVSVTAAANVNFTTATCRRVANFHKTHVNWKGERDREQSSSRGTGGFSGMLMATRESESTFPAYLFITEAAKGRGIFRGIFLAEKPVCGECARRIEQTA